jgi:hypothetical protein
VRTLEEVLREAREEAKVLDRAGAAMSVRRFEQWLLLIENSTAEFREFMSEGSATLRSGKSVAWFRSRFDDWRAQGLARYNPKTTRKERQYRSMIVPMRVHLETVREQARRDAIEDMKRSGELT